MAASQRVNILADKSAELSLLAEYLKNPKLVDQLAEDIKKLNALTEDQSKKLDEAKSFIANHEALKKSFDEKEKALAAEKADHEKQAADLDAAISTHVAQSTAFESVLNEKAKVQAEVAKEQELACKKLEDDTKNLAKLHEQFLVKLKVESDGVKSAKEANIAEAARLYDLSQALKEKSEKLKGILTE